MSSPGVIGVGRSGRQARARARSVFSRKMSAPLAVGAALGLDVVCTLMAVGVTEWLRTSFVRTSHHLDLWIFVLTAFWLTASGLRLYDLAVLRSVKESILRCLAGLVLAVVVVLIGVFALTGGERFLGMKAFVLLGTAAATMAAGRALLARFLDQGILQLDERIAWLGDGKLLPKPSADILIESSTTIRPPFSNTPEFYDALFRAYRKYDRIVIAFADKNERLAWAKAFRQSGLAAEVIEPGLAEVSPIALGKRGGHATLVVSRGALSLAERALKRSLDVGLTLAMVPVVLPLTTILLILVRLDSPGSSLFIQERVGRNNIPFKCYKIRTMQAGLGDNAGVRSTERNDPRVTRLGALLRRTSMDELPQLWNVLKGDMSLVGPRPHALGSTTEGDLFWESVQDYWTRHAVKPGITGLAQVRGYRGTTERREDLELRVASDLEYIEKWSIWLDLRILLQTACIVLFQRAY